MKDFNFNQIAIDSARAVKNTTRCREHHAYPDFKARNTSTGVSLSGTFCCPAQKAMVEKKLKEELDKNFGAAIENSLRKFSGRRIL